MLKEQQVLKVVQDQQELKEVPQVHKGRLAHKESQDTKVLKELLKELKEQRVLKVLKDLQGLKEVPQVHKGRLVHTE